MDDALSCTDACGFYRGGRCFYEQVLEADARPTRVTLGQICLHSEFIREIAPSLEFHPSSHTLASHHAVKLHVQQPRPKSYHRRRKK